MVNRRNLHCYIQHKYPGSFIQDSRQLPRLFQMLRQPRVRCIVWEHDYTEDSVLYICADDFPVYCSRGMELSKSGLSL